MIVGQKTIITALSENDITATLRWVNNPEIRYFNGTVYPVSLYEQKEWLLKRATSSIDKMFAIHEKENNELIGTIGLKGTDLYNSNAEVYYTIGAISDKKYQHGGYGQDALKTFTKYCFNELNLHKLYAKIYEYNERSINCAKKVGYIEEGRLKQHHFTNGKYWDILILSKLCERGNEVL